MRLAPHQDDAVEDRRRRRGVSASVALRDLLDLGITLDRAETDGVVITPAAIALLADGHAAHLAFLGLEDADAEGVQQLSDVLGITHDQAAAAAAGALLLMTREQRQALTTEHYLS